MPDNRVVERATEDDLAAVLAVDASTYGSAARRLADRGGDGTRVLPRPRPAGRARLRHPDAPLLRLPFIDLLIVHPDQRRKGAATALIEHIVTTCPGDKLFTSTNQSNAPMQALCERLGFVKSGWIDNLDPGDPEIIYFKALPKS